MSTEPEHDVWRGGRAHCCGQRVRRGGHRRPPSPLMRSSTMPDREFWGTDAIRGWVAREMVGDHVSIEVVEILSHHGLTVVRGRYDGDFDKANLPEELILTNYFAVSGGKIDSLIVIRNVPA